MIDRHRLRVMLIALLAAVLVVACAGHRALGGIAQAQESPKDGGKLIGAVWDRESGRLVLLGQDSPDGTVIRPDHVAAAIVCAFQPSDSEPAFSLDPAVAEEPDGPWWAAVYYLPGAVRGSDFARVMYEADWLLKQYCLGLCVAADRWVPAGANRVENVGGIEVFVSKKARTFRLTDRQPDVPGFKDMLELMLRGRGQNGQASRARMWIVSHEIVLREAGDAARFERVRMAIRAKRQEKDPKTGRLVDVDANEPIASEFAALATNLYEKLAVECRPFAEVRELAKAMALGKWLRQQKMDVDLEWASQTLSDCRVDVVEQVSRLTNTREQKTNTPVPGGVEILTRRATVSGGVDLAVKPKSLPDDGSVQAMRNAINPGLATGAPSFTFQYAGQTLRANVLSIGKGRRKPITPPVASPAKPPPGTPRESLQAVVFGKRGNDVTVQFGDRQALVWSKLADDLRSASVFGNASAGRRIADFWRDTFGEPGDQPMLLVHDAADVSVIEQLRTVLGKNTRRGLFITTTDMNRATANLKALQPLKRDGNLNVAACVLRDTLTPGWEQAMLKPIVEGEQALRLADSPAHIRDIDRENNLLVVVGDTGERLRDELANGGAKLRGKAIIFFACGESLLQQESQRLIEDCGVTMVWRPRAAIDLHLVPWLMDALNAVIAREPQTLPTQLMDKVIDEAIRRARQRDDRPVLQRLESLRNCDLRSEANRLEPEVLAGRTFGGRDCCLDFRTASGPSHVSQGVHADRC